MDAAVPSFICSSPGCDRSFSSLDRLVSHASKDHVINRPPPPSAVASTTLLQALTSRICASAKPLNLLLTSIACATAQVATRTLRARVTEKAGSVQVLESRAWGYTNEDVNGMFQALEEEGRSLYLALEAFEALVSMPVAALFFSHICTMSARRLSYQPLETFAALFPFLVAFLKFAENNTIAYLLLLYPEVRLSAVAGASVLTVFNVRVSVPILLGLACSLILAIPLQSLVGWIDAKYDVAQEVDDWEDGETEREVTFDEYEGEDKNEDEEEPDEESADAEKKVQ